MRVNVESEIALNWSNWNSVVSREYGGDDSSTGESKSSQVASMVVAALHTHTYTFHESRRSKDWNVRIVGGELTI